MAEPNLERSAQYAQYLVDTLGEQQAFDRLQRERVPLPRGWQPAYDLKRRLGLEHAQEEVSGQRWQRQYQQSQLENAQLQRAMEMIKMGPQYQMQELNRQLAQKGQRAALGPGGRITTEAPPELRSAREHPLGDEELRGLREKSDRLTSAMRAFGLMRGEAVEGTTGDPTATGWEGYIPNILQLITPGLISGMGGQPGVATRAAIGNVGSLTMKERSGGAIPAQEMERLTPFVPTESEDEEVVRTKLGGFINELSKILEENLQSFQAAERRVPIPLANVIQQRIKAGRSMKGGVPFEKATTGGLSREERIKVLTDALQRRRSRGQ